MTAATIEPVTWCRMLRVGPVCPNPCLDCKRADALLTDDDRARLLASVDLPPDPASLDATRPVDLDVCGVCEGTGWFSWQSGWQPDEWDSVECWGCSGTGTRGAA